LPPVRDESEPSEVDLSKQNIVCDNAIGGHLRFYLGAA